MELALNQLCIPEFNAYFITTCTGDFALNRGNGKGPCPFKYGHFARDLHG